MLTVSLNEALVHRSCLRHLVHDTRAYASRKWKTEHQTAEQRPRIDKACKQPNA